MSDWDSDMPRQRQNLQEAAAKRTRSKVEADPGLQLLNKDFFLWLGLALASGLAVIAVVYSVLPWIVAVSDRAISPAQRFTAAFASATALGALFALVVSVRKQNLAEHIASREITAAFTERFRSAAEQLGGTSPAERLAGVYAMAALADEYPTRRQQCVDVLCGYLRLPFDPTTDHLADRSTTTTHVFHDGRTHTTRQNPASRPFDHQVRETIVSVIREHTQPEVSISWSHLNFNLQGAHLINLNLSDSMFSGNTTFSGATFSGEGTSFGGATFSGESTSFGGATFSGEGTSFGGATFSGESTSFGGATFSGESTSFDKATFSGESTWFDKATFSGRSTWFDKATFSGESTWFGGATFSGEGTSFGGATFSGRSTWFGGATFSGRSTWFGGATFSGESTSFGGATFSGRSTWFDGATFLGESTSFHEATFSGRSTWFDGATFLGESTWFDKATFSGEGTWFDGATFSGEGTWFDGATFSGESTSFHEATFSGEGTWFDGATFSGVEVTFDRAVFEDGARVSLKDLVVENGASITRDGEPFHGWPPTDSSKGSEAQSG